MIEINGIKYIPKEQVRIKGSSKMATFLAMGMMLGGGIFAEKEKERPVVDIIKEYGLIQLKKSNLSRSQRDWVVWEFERNYTKINYK